MRKFDYFALSLSELSFIVLTNTDDNNVRNNAYNEIKRRFSKNGCNYDIFMEYEKRTIEKRGDSISEYIINPHTTSQKLMELYFNYVYEKNISMHGNLLFSELLLCNDNCKNSFFINFIKNEIQRIKARMAADNLTQSDVETLQTISNALNERLEKTIPFYREDNIIDAIADISCSSPYFLFTEKQKKEFMEKLNNNKMSKMKMIPIMLGQMILGSDQIDCFAMKCFAERDNARLTQQKRSILQCNNEIDYSFVDRDKILKLSNKRPIYSRKQL